MSDERWQPPLRFPNPPQAPLQGARIPPLPPGKNLPATPDHAQRFSSAEPADHATLPQTPPAAQDPAPRRRDRLRRLALRTTLAALVLLLLSLSGLEIQQFLQQQFELRPTLGWFFAGLIGVIVLGTLVLALREAADYVHLKNVGRLREIGASLDRKDSYGQAFAFCEDVRKCVHPDAAARAGFERFAAEAKEFHSDAEVLALFNREALAPLDAQCYRLIQRQARQAALFAALSPFAALDAALMLWRNLRLIRSIARHYGGRPGATASLMLTRQVIGSLLFAGASDLLADSLSGAFGKSALSMLSAQAGQGLANGLFTARVGLKTMQFCRPLAFSAAQRPSLKHLSRELLRSLRSAESADLPRGPTA